MNDVTSECKTVRALLQEYIEGTLTAARKAEVDAHLSRCHQCAQQVALVTRIVAALEAIPPAEPGAELPRQIAARLADMPSPAERRQLRAGWGTLSVYAAAVMAMTAVFMLAWPTILRVSLRLLTPIISRSQGMATSALALATGAWETLLALVPAGRALLETLWHLLPAITPHGLAYAIAEAGVIAAVVVISRCCRHRSLRAPFVNLL